MLDLTASGPLLTRAIVIGALGGIGLILTHVFSRRGPLIFPVYAGILASLAMVTARFPDVPFNAAFASVLAGMTVATMLALLSVLVRSAKHRRKVVASGRVIKDERPPRWALPLTALSLIASSAAAAFIAT
jgi:hypothetical protein